MAVAVLASVDSRWLKPALVRDRRLDFFLNLGFQLGIYRKCHLENIFERGSFKFRRLLVLSRAEARQVVAADGVHCIFELALERRPVAGISRPLEEEIDRPIELAARLQIVARDAQIAVC